VTSLSALNSISISSPLASDLSIVDSGATTRNEMPDSLAATATPSDPILFALSPFLAIRSAPINTASISPEKRALAAAPSGRIRYLIPASLNSQAVKREP